MKSFLRIFWLMYLKLEITDLSAQRLLLDHRFVHFKYDLAAKKCPHQRGSLPYLLSVGARASILFL